MFKRWLSFSSRGLSSLTKAPKPIPRSLIRYFPSVSGSKLNSICMCLPLCLFSVSLSLDGIIKSLIISLAIPLPNYFLLLCFLHPKNTKPSLFIRWPPSRPCAFIFNTCPFNFPELSTFKFNTGVCSTIYASYLILAWSRMTDLLAIEDVDLICFTIISLSPCFSDICMIYPS